MKTLFEYVLDMRIGVVIYLSVVQVSQINNSVTGSEII